MLKSSTPVGEVSAQRPWFRRRPWNREATGWLFWAGLALFCVLTMFFDRSPHEQVFTVYYDAGRHWLAGEALYDGTGWGFIYLPQSAVLFSPLGWLPYQAAAALARTLNIALFACGVWRFCRLAGREGTGNSFPLASLVMLPLVATSARHGQMTLAMAATMLLAVVELVDQRWWRAAFWLTLGAVLKPLSVVLVLLAVALYPRISWRMAVGVLVFLAIPFLAQRPAYVLAQYRESVQMLDDASKYALNHPGEYAQLFWMLKSAGLDIPESGQTAIRVLAALGTLALCGIAQRHCSRSRAGVVLLTLAMVYILLFNPRTERNTYSLLAPALAVFCTEAIVAQRKLQAWFLIGIVLALIASYPLGQLLTGGPTVWMKPLLCTLFLGFVIGSLARGCRGRVSLSGDTATLALPDSVNHEARTAAL